jgi:hypothetical protein
MQESRRFSAGNTTKAGCWEMDLGWLHSSAGPVQSFMCDSFVVAI